MHAKMVTIFTAMHKEDKRLYKIAMENEAAYTSIKKKEYEAEVAMEVDHNKEYEMKKDHKEALDALEMMVAGVQAEYNQVRAEYNHKRAVREVAVGKSNGHRAAYVAHW